MNRQMLGDFRPILGPLDPAPAGIEGPAEFVAEASKGLPAGFAQVEGAVSRLRRDGAELVWGEHEAVRSLEHLEELNRARGRSSLQIIRADPSLASWMQVGAWFNAGWRVRLLRRILDRGGWAPNAVLSKSLPVGLTWRVKADAAFWAGVQEEATSTEWRRLTQNSYVVLTYHRLAGEHRPGQQQLDVSPKRFNTHMRLLKWFKFRPISIEELYRFHGDPQATLPNRAYVMTFDDGYRDNAEPLLQHASNLPVLFVPTAALGGTAHWAGGERLLTWDELELLAAGGIAIGSHSRSHPLLPDLEYGELASEVAGSLNDLSVRLSRSVAAIAYPHGSHDLTSLKVVAESEYRLGFTTAPGRNGAGTHPFCLRRVGIWQRDSGPLFLWKTLTGEYFPGQARTSGRGSITALQRAARPNPSDVDESPSS